MELLCSTATHQLTDAPQRPITPRAGSKPVNTGKETAVSQSFVAGHHLMYLQSNAECMDANLLSALVSYTCSDHICKSRAIGALQLVLAVQIPPEAHHHLTTQKMHGTCLCPQS